MVYHTQTGLTESWEYDSMGRLKSAIGGGMRYEYSYYQNGLLREKKASGRTLLSYAYDLDGNKVSRRDITGKETGYVYNKDGQLTGVTDNGQPLATYRYHADGNVESLTIGKSLTTRYGYDTDRNLQSLQTTDGDSVLADSTFVYDANANRVEKTGLDWHG